MCTEDMMSSYSRSWSAHQQNSNQRIRRSSEAQCIPWEGCKWRLLTSLKFTINWNEWRTCLTKPQHFHRLFHDMLGSTLFVCSSGHATRMSTVHRHQRHYFFFQLTSWQQSFPLRLSQWLQGRVGRRQFHHRICVQRTKTWLPYKERKECSARGISLSSEGIKQLNYQVLQQNVLDEIQCPIEKMRPTDIYKPCHIIQTPKSAHWPQSLRRKSMSSCVRKRVIDAWTFKTYPYGCERMINENMDMTELLCHL